MSATAVFSSRCPTDDVPGISSTFGATERVHASAICAGVRPSLAASAECGVAEDGIVRGEGRAEREERNERDVVFDAGVEHRLRSPVGEVVGVLHADDLGAIQRDLQMLNVDAAQPDSADEPVVPGVDHRAELAVEQLTVDLCRAFGIGRFVVHAKVDRGQPVGAERVQVLLDAGPKFVGLLRRKPPPASSRRHRPCSPAPGRRDKDEAPRGSVRWTRSARRTVRCRCG